jgi:O-antigen biosynthesis protein
VPEFWLDQLKGLAACDAGIGMVGAMSNHAPPHQSVGQVPYRVGSLTRWHGRHASPDDAGVPLQTIEAFARQWRQRFQGQWFETDTLSTFCVLMRRELLQAIGPTFPAAALGIADEELSLRARTAGFRLACCRDLFVHYFGTRSATRRSAG